MKELLLHLAKYNVWANDKFIKELQKLNDEQLNKEIVSSFPSIRKTIYHMWSAEFIWLQRLHLIEQPIWIGSDYDGDFATAVEKWKESSNKLVEFVEQQKNDDAFTHVVQYYNLKKQSNKMPVYKALMQVLNHATYHRGQLVTMMRQAGVKKIPATDFMLYKK